MQYGQCRLCHTVKDLVDSHAIPESAFKLLMKGGSGHMILVTEKGAFESNNPPDTGGSYLFCSACEKFLNESYDQYGIGVLKGENGKAIPCDDGVHFSQIDVKRLRMFTISILWRMAVSDHRFFSQVQLPLPLKDEIFNHVKNRTFVPRRIINLGFYRLQNNKKLFGFTQTDLRIPVFSPFVTSHSSIVFIMYGFAFEFFLGKMKAKPKGNGGILGNARNRYRSRYTDIFAIPELATAILGSLEMEENT